MQGQERYADASRRLHVYMTYVQKTDWQRPLNFSRDGRKKNWPVPVVKSGEPPSSRTSSTTHWQRATGQALFVKSGTGFFSRTHSTWTNAARTETYDGSFCGVCCSSYHAVERFLLGPIATIILFKCSHNLATYHCQARPRACGSSFKTAIVEFIKKGLHIQDDDGQWEVKERRKRLPGSPLTIPKRMTYFNRSDYCDIVSNQLKAVPTHTCSIFGDRMKNKISLW